jgi:hypothetical protein
MVVARVRLVVYESRKTTTRMSVMPIHHLGNPQPVETGGGTLTSELEAFETALGGSSNAAGDGDALGQNDQLERDIAEIERATAALRRGEPALETWNESWTGNAPALAHKPRPVWLLVGLLWLSTALVAVGAVAAIAHLAG